MAIWEDLVSTFRGKTNLNKVSEDELRKERINLDQKERSYIQQIQRAEQEQKELLAAGMKEPSEHMKMVYARKVVDKDADIRMNQKVLQSLTRQIRIVHGLEMVKKWAQITGRDRSQLLNKVSLAELTKWVHDKTVDGEFKDEYMEDLSGEMDRGIGVLTEVGSGEDSSVKKVFEIMSKANVDGAAVDKVQGEIKATLNTKE